MGYKYIFYNVKSSNCTILSVSAAVIMLMYNLEMN